MERQLMKTLALALMLLAATNIMFSQQWKFPDKMKNATVLPKDITAKELGATMRGFTGALGVRCNYCHVGEEGKDLRDYDFESDAKPEKAKARTMIKMVEAVNTQYLSQLSKESSNGIQVSCVTCHRGVPVPMALEDVLKKTFDHSGLDSTIKEYRALREKYYGGNAYNFKEGTLLRLADKIFEDSTKRSAAFDIVRLNIEMYPSFPFSYAHLGSWYDDMKNVPLAIENYKKALSFIPENEFLKKRIAELEKK
jgi:tetratricopeptide (TPR) repeat protein